MISLQFHVAVARRYTLPRSAVCSAMICGVLVVVVVATTAAKAQLVDSLRVMSYNILVGGAEHGPLSRTVGVIQAAQADVIGMQEVYGSAPAIAAALGYFYHDLDGDNAIVSRYPITQVFNHGVSWSYHPGRRHISSTSICRRIPISRTTFTMGSSRRKPKRL